MTPTMSAADALAVFDRLLTPYVPRSTEDVRQARATFAALVAKNEALRSALSNLVNYKSADNCDVSILDQDGLWADAEKALALSEPAT